jgi:SecD/SecF fusion protein
LTGNQNRILLAVILVLTVCAAVVAFNNKLFGADVAPKYGLDIKGGVRVILRAKTEQYKGGKWTPEKLEAIRSILEKRVNATGVAEPLLITKLPDQIIVELPGLKDEKQALEQLQSTANLQFYWLPQLGNKNNTRSSTWLVEDQTDPATGAKKEVLVDATTKQPLSPAVLEEQIFSKEPLVAGKDLLPNSEVVIQGTGGPVIQFEFNPEGGRVIEEFTRVPSHLGDYLAVFLDQKLLTAPTINGTIPGKGIIEGNFTEASARSLSEQLNAGALPVPLETLETRKLEATLGAEAVKATTVAGAIGLGMVLLFMLIYYRLPGGIADIALVLYTLFSFALFKLWPVTLTLPGIAGFILSIGMAVDANILIFERVKEELRSGKTLRASIDAGFKRAFTAISDSNICTLITCSVLYYFGTGPIKGFALTLGIGVAISMFTAITVTRTFLFALVGQKFAQNPAAYGLGIQWNPNLRVMSRKMFWLGISGIIIVPGLIFWAMGGIKKSIDFQGGTELNMPFATRHTSEEIQKALVGINAKYADSRVVVSEDLNSKPAFVTTPRLAPEERTQVIQSLIAKVGPLAQGRGAADVAYSDVSGTISQELTFDAIKAVLVASLLIVLFLAFRFSIGGFKEGLKYGLCAVAALLHDVAVVWGAFAIMGYLFKWQIDSLFVTAMLTVIGFSVHDTIIIFDRMRENLQHRLKGENFSDLADRSIDQTIARSLNTSFTVILTLFALFFFGGAIIHQFVGALLIGIISGTYSSIFNASVLLVLWKQRDAGGILTTSGALSGPKSGLTARPNTLMPGDRPLVKPSTAATPAFKPEGSDEGSAGASKPGTVRRQPVRRRRM